MFEDSYVLKCHVARKTIIERRAVKSAELHEWESCRRMLNLPVYIQCHMTLKKFVGFCGWLWHRFT